MIFGGDRRTEHVNVTVIECDVCGKFKVEEDTWLKADVNYQYCNGVKSAVNIELGGLLAHTHNTDICGDGCLQKVINEVISSIRSGH